MWRLNLVVVIVLGAGIALSTALASVVNALWLGPRAESLAGHRYFVYGERGDGRRHSDVPFALYRSIVERRDVWQAAATRHDTAAFLVGDLVQRVAGESVSGAYFDVMQARAQVGTLPGQASVQSSRGMARPIVLSDRMWRQSFGGSSDVIGTTVWITLNLLESRRRDATEYTIVGVAEPGFIGVSSPLEPTQYWVLIDDRWLDRRCEDDDIEPAYGVVPVLRAPAEMSDAEVTDRLGTVNGVTSERVRHNDPRWRLVASTDGPGGILLDCCIDPVALAAALVAMAGGFLAVCLVNVAGLFRARAVAGGPETKVRRLLGAGAWQAARPLVMEWMAIALVAGLAGLWGSRLLVKLAVAGMPAAAGPTVPVLDPHVPLDGRVLLFAALLVGVIVLTIAAPIVWRASRRAHELPGSDQVVVGGSASAALRLSAGVPQVAVVLVLLLPTGSLLLNAARSWTTPLGFEAEGVAFVRYGASLVGRCDPRAEQASVLPLRWADLSARAIAGVAVTELAIATGLPWTGGHEVPLTQRETGEHIAAGSAVRMDVAPSYFETVGIPLLAGRGIDISDARADARVVVVSSSLATRLWPDGPVIGRELGVGSRLDDDVEWRQVAGVVGDVRPPGGRTEALPLLYLPLSATRSGSYALVRVTPGAAGVVPAQLESALLEADDRLVAIDRGLLSDRIAAIAYPRAVLTWLASAASIAALLVVSLGLYGQVSFAVARRTREIALRSALGARRHQVIWLVARSGATTLAAGCLLGVLAGWWVVRLLEARFPEMPPMAWSVAAGAALLASGAVGLACYLPARKSARVDPAAGLRAL
jgi:predicted permease